MTQPDLLGMPAHLTLEGQIACVEREIKMRVRVYPRWVEANRMTQEKASQEIESMRAVLITLQEVQRGDLIMRPDDD